jgi:hypothetical protein
VVAVLSDIAQKSHVFREPVTALDGLQVRIVIIAAPNSVVLPEINCVLLPVVLRRLKFRLGFLHYMG